MKRITQIKKMKSLLAIAVFIIIGVIFSNSLLAQEHAKKHGKAKEGEHVEHVFKNQRKNIVLFSYGYTYIPLGSAIHHESDGVFVPSIGLDYKRRISEKWALSLFTDWEMDHYVLFNKEFSRDRAFVAVIGCSYEIAEGLGTFAGFGREFENSHDLWVFRLGLEYGIDLGKHWVFVPSVFYDWKEFYSTYSFSFGLSYKF